MYRWEDNIKIDLIGIWWESWAHLAQKSVVMGSCEHGNEHLGVINVENLFTC
jgi:hypothetical protein